MILFYIRNSYILRPNLPKNYVSCKNNPIFLLYFGKDLVDSLKMELSIIVNKMVLLLKWPNRQENRLLQKNLLLKFNYVTFSIFMRINTILLQQPLTNDIAMPLMCVLFFLPAFAIYFMKKFKLLYGFLMNKTIEWKWKVSLK